MLHGPVEMTAYTRKSTSQNSSGQPYILVSGTPEFTFGTVDFTNPDAVAWYASVIQDNMLAINTVCAVDVDFLNVMLEPRSCLLQSVLAP